MQHSLNLLSRYNVPVALVKYTEALLRLFVTSGFILSVSNPVLAECEIDAITLLEIGIALPQFFVNLARVHFVESKVLKNVSEVVCRDVASLVTVVE